MVLWVGLQCVVVVVPDNTYLPFICCRLSEFLFLNVSFNQLFGEYYHLTIFLFGGGVQKSSLKKSACFTNILHVSILLFPR